METQAAQSVVDQAAVEAADTMPFEIYRQQYVSADRLMARRVGNGEHRVGEIAAA